MKSVFVLFDHSHLDLLLVPVIEQLIKRNIDVIPCVCDAGKSDLLESKKIPYIRNFSDFSQFANLTGSRLFLNAADMNYPAHEKGRMADELCRECGIPSLTMEHGVNPLYFDKVSENSMFNADRIALTGTKSFEMFKAKGCSPQQLVITGSPKFDLYYQLDSTIVIKENQRRLNLNANRQYLLITGVNHRFTVVGDHSEQKWIRVLSSLFAAIRRKFPNFDILIKPHPAEGSVDTVKLYEAAIAPEDRTAFKIIDPHYSLPHAILGSVFTITFSASVILESFLLNRPVVFMAGPIRLPSAILDCQKSGAVIVQSEWDQAAAVFDEEVTRHSLTEGKSIQLSEAFISAYVHKWDGKASHRISHLIERILDRQPIRIKNGIITDPDTDARIKRPLLDDVGFERYQRLMGVADEVRLNIEGRYSLLDVGSEDACFKKFISGLDYQSFDGLISSATNSVLPHADNAFDVVVASDVLEHVIPADRKFFIQELVRVAKRRVVFSFPSAAAAEFESLILEFAPGHQWLMEHRQNGLPETNEIEALLDELKLNYRRKPNSSLATWVHSVLIEFLPVDPGFRRKLNSFCQEKLFETENREPAYRYIYTIDMRAESDHIEKAGTEEVNWSTAKEPKTMPVSIVIPVYNQIEFTRRCLDSIFENTSPELFEIYVVDNASTDGTNELLEDYKGKIKVVSNSKNLGFAKACNQGAQAARGEFVVFLNNDTEVAPGWLEALVKSAQTNDQRAIIGSKLLYPDRTVQHAGVAINDTPHLVFPYHIHSRCGADAPVVNVEREYQAVTGACMLVRKDVFNALGGFDEEFHNGYEDVDLCFQAREAGYLVFYCPESEVCHHESVSNGRFDAVEHNIKRLHQKWSGKIYPDRIVFKDRSISKLTSIIILTFNQLAYTKKCLASIFDNTLEPFELIVVDNGSGDGTDAYLEEMKSRHPEIEFTIIRNLKNLGFAAGNNQGLAESRGDYIVLLNNDVVVTPGWLKLLSNCVESKPGIGIAGPKTNSTNGPQLVETVTYDTTSLNGLNEFAYQFTETFSGQTTSCWRPVGFCMLIKREVINRIGGLDPRFAIGNFEDDDFCLRAHIAGYEAGIAEDCFVHHFGGRTFEDAAIDYHGSLEKNWEIFKAKWKIDSDTPFSSTYNVPLPPGGFEPEHHYIPLKADFERKDIEKPYSPVPPEDNAGVPDANGNADDLKNALDKLEKADLHCQRGEFTLAKAAFLKAMQLAPEEKKIYHAYATALIETKQFQEAFSLLDQMPDQGAAGEQGRKTLGQDMVTLLLKGYCKEGLGDYTEAEAYADHVIGLNPYSARALNLKGILAYRKTDLITAQSFFSEAIEADAGYGEPYTNLGNLSWQNEQFENAFYLFEKGFRLSPMDSDIAAVYHSAVGSLKAYEQAEPVIQHAAEAFPQNRSLSNLLIDVLLHQEKHEEAMLEIERAMTVFNIDDGLLEASLNVRSRLGPMRIQSTADTGSSVSLCMIAKNEASRLANCLHSIKPLVDEIIVVDTGSSDRTRDIATAFGAVVYDFEWNNDFAAARNFSLAKASGNWILVMDADEVISPLDYRAFKAITAESPNGTRAFSIVTRNYTMRANAVEWVANDGSYEREESGVGWYPSEKVRLFYNDERIRFEFAVHELVDPSLERVGIPIAKCKIPVHHYGDLLKEEIDDKGRKYLKLGEMKQAELGDDAAALRELAVQAGNLGQYQEAIGYWQRYLSLVPDMPEAYVNMGTALWHLGQYEDALAAAKNAVSLAPEMKEAHFNLAINELYLGNGDSAAAILEQLKAEYPDYLAAEFMLATAYCCNGQISSGLAGFDKLNQSSLGPGLVGAFTDSAARLLDARQEGYARSVLEAAIQSGNRNEEIDRLLSICG